MSEILYACIIPIEETKNENMENKNKAYPFFVDSIVVIIAIICNGKI